MPFNPAFNPGAGIGAAAQYFTVNMAVAIPEVAGVDSGEWDDIRLMKVPFFPTAFAEARRRVPCDWALLDAPSQYWLQLALIQYTAALVVAAADPGRTEDVKIGAFSLKTDDTGLLADQGELLSQAAVSYANIVLPPGVVPVAASDGFARPMIRTSSVCNAGPGRLC